MERTRTSDVAARNAFFTRTTAVVTGVTTYINIEANGIAMFKDADSILLCDIFGGIYPLLVNGDVSGTDTRINIVSYDFGADQILAGALISFDAIDMVQEYQRKTKGKIAGMPVSADTLGPIQYTGGRYIANFDSSNSESSNPTVKVLIGLSEIFCMIETIKDESTPPLKKAPRGTSDCICNLID